MTELDMDVFEARLEQRLQRYADIPVRDFSAASITGEVLAHRKRGLLTRLGLGWSPVHRPAFASMILVLVLTIVLALALAVVAASLINRRPNPVLGRPGVIAYTFAESWESRDSHVYLINPDGTGAREIAQGAGSIFSGDGRSLAYWTGFGIGRAELYVGGPEGSEPRHVPGFNMQGYALSPDGTRVAMPYNDDRGYSGEIRLFSVETGEVQSLFPAPADFPDSGYDLDETAWSPDGRRIAVAVFKNFPGDISGPYRVAIVVADTDTGDIRLVTSRLGQSAAVAWSPDSKSIAFVGWPDGAPGPSSTLESVERHPEIYSVDVDTTAETRLTSGAVSPDNPQWSPDGRSLGYISMGDGAPTLAVVDVNESGDPAVPLVGPVAADFRWSPDASALATMTIRENVPFDPSQGDVVTLQVVSRDLAQPPRTILEVNGGIGSLSWQRLDP